MRPVNILLPTLWTTDTVATSLFVSAGGVELEANPLMYWLIDTHGIGVFIVVKLLVLTFWLTLANRIHWGIHVALSVLLAVVVYMGLSIVIHL